MNGNGAMTIVDDREAMLGGIARQNQVEVSTAIQLAAALIDKRIATARQWPRSVARFKEEASDLLRNDVETARSAEYAKPVGGGTVRGPSIRLAEIAAMCWGNLEITIAEPVVGDKSVTVTATAYDMERNYTAPGMSTATIIDKYGNRYKQHMIETTILACASKARRNAIQAVIPRAYINDLLETAKKVAAGNEKPLEQRRIDALDYLARTHKVQPERVFAMLSVGGIDDITSEHLDELRAVITAIKEGTAAPEEFFPAAETSKADELKKKLADRQAAKKPASEPEKPASETKPATETPPTAQPDKLADLIAEFDAKGGDWPAFLGEHNAQFEDITNSTKSARSKWCDKLSAAIRGLKTKGDGQLFGNSERLPD